MIKLSDYVFEYLADRGVTDVFLVSGGGIMHLCDSVGRNPRIRYIANNHEQACAIAAEAYARVTNRIGVCLVTTGPGSANALSGVVGAWFDSIPVLVISGQVRVPLIADYSRHRQIGPQEINILPMVRPVTKYAVTVTDPGTIRTELDTAIAAARGGRPGPVWIDIPLDVQAAMIEEDATARMPEPAASREPGFDSAIRTIFEMLQESKRPVLVAGNGVRLAGAEKRLVRFVEEASLPVLLPIGGMDLVPESHPAHMGSFGPVGRRSANFALQNSDLMLCIGAGMSIAAIGFNTEGFAPKAKKILINVDRGEISKPNLAADISLRADAADALDALLRHAGDRPFHAPTRWTEACSAWKVRYPAVDAAAHDENGFVNSYAFVDRLSALLEEGDTVVTGNSLDACSIYQAFRVKRDQRVLIPINCGAMGWDLPAAVGAASARKGKRVILVTGDGSIQFNIQELMTIRQYALPIKIFVFNNDGYESIRATQSNYFEGRFVGSDRASGIGNPDFERLAAAYGFTYDRVQSNRSLEEVISRALASDGPSLAELILSPTQARTPKVSSFRREDGTLESRPLEDMFPFLPREEIWRNMHLFDEP